MKNNCKQNYTLLISYIEDDKMNPILYTIRPGDTLYNLAIQYGTTVEDINAFDMVQKEILKMSQFFVDGIVRQFPNLF